MQLDVDFVAFSDVLSPSISDVLNLTLDEINVSCVKITNYELIINE